MTGYRNVAIILAAIATSTWLVHAGIAQGTDMVGLATVIGAKDAAAVGAIFGRGYYRGKENGGGK